VTIAIRPSHRDETKELNPKMVILSRGDFARRHPEVRAAIAASLEGWWRWQDRHSVTSTFEASATLRHLRMTAFIHAMPHTSRAE
jgi:hypothetical protein